MTNELIQIDCMEYMKDIPDNHFDLGIVDPPYGIGADKPSIKPTTVKQKNGTILNVISNKHQHKEWDNSTPNKKYFNELFRISKNQIIWGVNYYNYILNGGRIFWDKCNGNSDQYDGEIAYQSFNNSIRKLVYMWSGMCQGKSITEGNIQQGNKKLNEKRIHLTQKPVALYKWLLTNYAKPGDKLFDSHSGSGSFRIAAYDMGFDLISCELDPDYCRDNEARFRNYIKQIDLFKPEEIQEKIYRQNSLNYKGE